MRILLFLLFALFAREANPWGFQAHRTINEMAVYLLPASSFAFYRPFIDELVALATKADQRRYAVEGEAERHFIDIDHFEHCLPLDTIRISWDSAVGHYGTDSLRAHGILPWSLLWTFAALRRSIREGDTLRAIRKAADLGHYLADAHVPLHTTSNYNGQKTGQKGIHSLWETRLPQLYLPSYRLRGERQERWCSVDSIVWTAISESHAAKDSVLGLERIATTEHPAKFGFEQRNGRWIRTYEVGFCNRYHQSLQGMVERRMLRAVERLALLWHLAWISAQLAPDPTEWVEPSIPTVLYRHSGRDTLH